MRICFGLHGGLGNCIFALPAIKLLSERHKLSIYVEGDYPQMRELFQRCRYAPVVDMPQPADRYLCAQYPPRQMGQSRWIVCGWPDGTSRYVRPEWQQIIERACRTTAGRVDVTDWVKDLRREPRFDVGLIAGCKPGYEWSRKKWPRMRELAGRLVESGRSVIAFGLEDEIGEAGLAPWYGGRSKLRYLPELLCEARQIVGTDSGVTQLAASIGLPTTVIYTATCPTKGDPVAEATKISKGLSCAPCQSTPRWRACTNWRCREISVEEVMAVL